MFPLWPAGEGNVGCRREAVAGSSETGCCEAPPRGLGPYGCVGGASEWGVACEPVCDGLFRSLFLRDGCFEAAPSRGENVELSAEAFAGLLPVACQPAAVQSCATDSF